MCGDSPRTECPYGQSGLSAGERPSATTEITQTVQQWGVMYLGWTEPDGDLQTLVPH